MNDPYKTFFKNAKRAANGKPAAPVSDGRGQVAKDQTTSLESVIKQELNARISAKRQQRRQRERFQLPERKTVIISVSGLAALLALIFLEPISEFTQRHLDLVQVNVTQAGAADPAAAGAKGGEKAAEPGKDKEEKAASTIGADKPKDGAKSGLDVSQWTPEEMSFFKKLSDRKQQLDQRESELNKMEEELQKQKVEIEARIKQLEKMRGEITTILSERVKQDQERVDKLVQVYSNMKPAQAAKLLEGINEDLAMEILNKMKKKSAADILNVMESKKVQKLSEMLVGYKRKPASENETKK